MKIAGRADERNLGIGRTLQFHLQVADIGMGNAKVLDVDVRDAAIGGNA